jgi:hypothetical protein
LSAKVIKQPVPVGIREVELDRRNDVEFSALQLVERSFDLVKLIIRR